MRKLGLVSSFDIKMVTAGMWMIEYCLIVYLKLSYSSVVFIGLAIYIY